MQQSEAALLEPAPKRARIEALDVYRGLVMFGMILVDNQASKPLSPLDESEWDGLSPADLIFPAFLFIMGIAVPLSLKGPSLGVRPFARSVGLFAIGLFLHLQAKNFDFTRVRIMGVLQRIALCYLTVALFHWGAEFGKNKKVMVFLWVGSAVLYLGLMVGLSLNEGCLALTPTCNFGRTLDMAVFGYGHMMKPSDPEGIVSTFSSLVTVLGGYFLSLVIKEHRDHKVGLVQHMAKFGLAFLLLTIPLLLLQPLNKKLWSLSFSTATVGISTLGLTLSVLLVDCLPLLGERTARAIELAKQPFKWLGANPLAVFVGMLELDILLLDNIKWDNTSLWSHLYHWLIVSWAGNGPWQSFLWSLLHALLWTVVAFILHRRGIFIKL